MCVLQKPWEALPTLPVLLRLVLCNDPTLGELTLSVPFPPQQHFFFHLKLSTNQCEEFPSPVLSPEAGSHQMCQLLSSALQGNHLSKQLLSFGKSPHRV